MQKSVEFAFGSLSSSPSESFSKKDPSTSSPSTPIYLITLPSPAITTPDELEDTSSIYIPVSSSINIYSLLIFLALGRNASDSSGIGLLNDNIGLKHYNSKMKIRACSAASPLATRACAFLLLFIFSK